MSDWEISGATQAQLTTVAKALLNSKKVGSTSIMGPDGYPIEGFLADGTRFSISYYKNKFSAAGVQIAGFYAIMRWLSPTNANPPQPPANSGVTLIPLPANSLARFAS